ncbi:hypothetical protein JOD29_000559 [Lysinibacillus composti]|nr:hypothetical protein [Lysinibacillus composti]MBM7607322.1 hypothetical protein [Lysinibacillus composti]
MWVITVFLKDTYRIYEFEDQKEALLVMKGFKEPAILSFSL